MRTDAFLKLLGLKVRDRVTGYEGIVATVGFDLYGCVQAVVNPGLDKDGKLRDSNWFDVNRLEVLDETPVMERPSFASIVPARPERRTTPTPPAPCAGRA